MNRLSKRIYRNSKEVLVSRIKMFYSRFYLLLSKGLAPSDNLLIVKTEASFCINFYNIIHDFSFVFDL